MIIFLYGPDTYRSQQKLNEIIERYKKIHKSGLNLKYFEGKELKFQDFKTEFETASMFAEKKLFVVKNIFSNSEFKEEFLKGLTFFKDSKDLILFYDEDISKNNSLFNFLKENAQSQEFEILKGQKLKNWVKREFSYYDINISPRVIEKLIDFVGSDLWQMSNEIKKLISYIKPGSKIISEKEVELLVKPKIDTNIFKTIDAIALRDKKLALKLIHQHLEKGDSPLYLFSMLNFQFRNLLTIKSREQYREIQGIGRMISLSKELGLPPYVIKKTLWQLKRFSFAELKKIYQKLFQVDLDMKTGRIDPETALDILIAEI